MKVFYATGFKGHWPVGTSAVIVARNKDEAYVLLTNTLIGKGLPQSKDQDFQLEELSTDSTHVIILQDGDY